MDILRLPITTRNRPLAECFSLMRRHRRSGLISVEDGRAVVYHAAEIVRGIASEKETLADLEGRPLSELESLKIPRRTLRRSPLGRGHRRFRGTAPWTFKVTDAILSKGVEFGVVDFQEKSAVVVSMRETWGAAYTVAPENCYCQGPDAHPYRSLPPGGVCRYDPFPVVCVR